MNIATRVIFNRIPNIAYWKTVRYLRGGVTVKMKIPKEKWKNPKYSDPLFRNNIGINNMLKIYTEDGELHEDIEDLRHMEPDDLEPNAMGYNQAYNMHMEEQTREDEKKHFFKLRRKFDKEEKFPNMLTYTEKEQIRYLHSEDPDLWTVEKLAASFPATVKIIKKILKSKWKARDEKEILKHDRGAEKNWNLFRDNKLELRDEELRMHLFKFTNRRVTHLSSEDLKNLIPQKSDIRPKPAEFGEIIESYNVIKGEKTPAINIEDNEVTTDSITVPFFTDDVRTNTNKQHTTLDDLRDNLRAKASKSELDMLILNSAQEPSVKKLPPLDNTDDTVITNSKYISVDAYSSNTKVVSSEYNLSITSIGDEFPLRIDIPKEKWKKGMTYKVRDRFYDYDGTFLYRVPGFVH